ncbi:MAG: helicase C-terminal domain-containing protein [Candidatus Tritonobacter lacicola]|nr:helicase C-terminal domain-containing protein [Candidatus Tritonobacter lacicola]
MKNIGLRVFFSNSGQLAKHLPGHEQREEQIAMAEAIEEAIDRPNHLLVEAGTGVGKSLAYLVPLVSWAVKTKKRVLVSTYTKTLQTQLIEKDIPLLKDCVETPFEAALCLGANNYLCLRKLNNPYQMEIFKDEEELRQLEMIRGWSMETGSGVVSELDFSPLREVWEAVSRDHEFCHGRRCPHRTGCFYARARFVWKQANLLVANHHLFFANLASGGGVLPEFECVILDEAHRIEDAATGYFGEQVSNRRVPYLLGQVYRPKENRGFAARHVKGERILKAWEEIIGEVEDANRHFFRSLGKLFGQSSSATRLRERLDIDNALAVPLRHLIDQLDSMKKSLSEEARDEARAYMRRAKEISWALDFIIEQKGSDLVYWYEASTRRRRLFQSMNYAPIDVSEVMREQVFDRYRSVILTSATMASAGDFDFIRSRLGVRDADQRLLGSPFDFKENALLFSSKSIPDPRRKREEYEKKVATLVEKIIRANRGGGIFVLFTSYRMLYRTFHVLEKKLGDYTILCQGKEDRYRLLEKFRKDIGSVLFGTSTFWMGVDIPGKALQCVIITKLPFEHPDEPVVQARLEKIAEDGGDAFREYSLPQAVLMLRQGFGRLIRTKKDYGVIAILDPRLHTRPYGRKFLDALPETSRSDKIEDISAFLEKKKACS